VTRALVLKELRALRPWVVLSLCIGLIDIAEAFVHQTDMRPLSHIWNQLGSANGIVMWIIAFAIGTGLVTREQDDGTLVFLDGLPVSRTHVFAVKCILTCGLLAIAPCVTLVSLIAQHLVSRGSLDAQLRPDILLGLFGLQMAAIVQGVFVGAAMGMLRSLTWLITSAIAVLLALVTERIPRVAFLNPVSLLYVDVTSAGLHVDKETLQAQLAFAVIAALIAWWGFVRSGQPSRLPDLSKRPALGATITALTLIAVASAVAIAGRRSHAAKNDDDDDEAIGEEAGNVRFEPSPPAQTATKHYHLSYDATQANQALALAARADDIYERVHAMLGAPLGESIDVDTSGSARNTEGTAYFGRVRMYLNDHAPIVLAHETSHVVAQRLAGREHDWLWQKAQVLNEGLATYVEQKYEADTLGETEESRTKLANDRLLLAALYARHELLVPEICDYHLLATMRDDDLKYPLGAAVIRAMVRLYGPDSISRLVRAFANDKLPSNLNGLAMTEATFQIARMDFAAVIAELFKQAADDAQQHAAELAALPRPRVRLVRNGETGSIGVQALSDAESAENIPRTFFLRFTPRPDSSFDLYDTSIARGDRPAWRPASRIRQGEVCVQVGLRLGRGRIVYEPWTCLPTSDAAPWGEPDNEG
jgi:ABC-type transport system involved in multi-copper enzyme maturation permease subunit